MSSPRALLISGATGKQGGALIAALLAQPSQPFQIYALTRNAQSAGARSLASKPGVKVIQGEYDNPSAAFEQVKDPWGFFLLTTPMGRGGATKEEAQGRAMAKVAAEAGVKHLVFASVERKDNDTDNHPVPHFASKKRIEDDIRAKMGSSKETSFTFLRPVAFLDNFTNDFFGKVFYAAWGQNGMDTKLQFIGCKDIGRIAAQVFLDTHNDPNGSVYRNKAISLATEDMSPNEAAKIFKEVTEKEIPTTYGIFGRLLKLVVDDMNKMMAWFKDVGYGVDVKQVKAQYPFVQDFRTWLREESAWRKK